ncbi:MAG: hypothetical protein JO013_08825 [Alphaproteobacteria bacterium]|nr:hypothetical protein [Alphaproteobacteria bacterium]
MTMPYWPAWLLGAVAAACAVPAFTAPAPASEAAEVRCAPHKPGWERAIGRDGATPCIGRHGAPAR